ncbi:hypothetical protein [Glycomyces xiaoerkulensis]|uniref:hypothetical protein n=1 Tax=Glycomyces xiaoerkulensis TaxID=2038139 RepID=UPI000C2589AD|nr:hypothetical protein [Glycomyces xiaoerkulensis]
MPEFDLRMFLQISGALLCIVNYVLIQTRRLAATQPSSLIIVAFGGLILLSSAIMGGDWGLILLEVSWLVMVIVTLIVRHREAVAAATVPTAASPAAMTSTGELELVGVGDSLHV